MKKLLSFLIIGIFLFSVSNISAMANPAAKFCLDQGNEYEKRADSEGNEFGVCIVDEEEKEEWKYYKENKPAVKDIQILEGSLFSRKIKKSLKIEDKEVFLKEEQTLRSEEKGMGSPLVFDWRTNSGSDWTTAIRNQGSCGSCWAFSSVAVTETKTNIDLNNANYDADLSEQDVISNSNPTMSNCTYGGLESDAMNFMQNTGIVKESCMPYTQSDSGTKCPNGNNEKLRISGYTIASANAAAIKTAISTYGLVTVGMYADSDFDSYSGGIYTHSSLDWEGGLHSVALVGYNDTGAYWIAKNSWGTGWGESGYFRIAYSENVFLDSTTWWNNPDDNRVFFLDESYYVTGTDIATPPTVNNTQVNNTYVKSTTPINFSVYAIPKSIKQLSSVKINGTSMTGSLQYGGTFSIANTSAQLGCAQGSEGTCILTINATDDAGKSSTTSTSITVDDLAPKFYSNSSSLNRHTNFTAEINASDRFVQYTWIESNLSGTLQNYTYFVNSSSQILSKNFNATTTNSSFSFRWGANDSAGNYNVTEWISLSVENNPPASSSIPNITWTVNSNYTLNLTGYFSDIDSDSLIFNSTEIANVSTSINQTRGIITFSPEANFTGTRTFQIIANDSTNWTESNNITLDIFRPAINFSNFNGLTTNFSELDSFVGLVIVFEKNTSGMINFSSVTLNLTNLDFDNNINISDNFIEINSSALSVLNTSATLTLYNLSFSTPIIYKNGQVCLTNLCTQLSYTNSTFVFNVSSFSNYTTKESSCGDTVCSSSAGETCSTCSTDCGTCPAPPSSGSGGGGGGGGGGGATTGWLLNKKATESQLNLGYSLELSKNQRVQFNVSNESHYVGVKNITGSSILLEIASNPRNETLSVNETKKFEITNDDYYDLQITLNSIISGKANLTITWIYEQITKNVTAPLEEANQSQEREISNTKDDSSPSSNSNKLIGLVIIAAVVIFVFIKLFRKKTTRKKKRTKKLPKHLEEEIKDGFK